MTREKSACIDLPGGQEYPSLRRYLRVILGNRFLRGDLVGCEGVSPAELIHLHGKSSPCPGLEFAAMHAFNLVYISE